MNRMPYEDAKAKIIRLNEGGTLLDFPNEQLRIEHLQGFMDSLIYTHQKEAFLYAITTFASVTAPKDADRYRKHRSAYRRLHRNAARLLKELDNQPLTLF